MANIQRNFTRGRMNKSLDERLVPKGEYIDALNIRLGSTESSDYGSVENSKGNTLLTTLMFDDVPLSNNARCIGAYEDGTNETLYWFVHDPAFTLGNTSKIDLIVSYNTNTNSTIYHIVSINDGNNLNTTLNFSPYSLITGVNLVDNLLFFTDNYNPPRVINIQTSYSTPLNYLDQFTAEALLVIKRPPIESPSIQMLTVAGNEENFLEERFISFAYRYKYADGEYSATSQFSDAAFDPGSFNFSQNSFANEGMLNSKNAVIITFNSGSSLVTGVDLLFKESTNSTIKIIEKLDKANLGYSNNTNYTFSFDNSKIFTLLPESEILRLYDNVPKIAKAQTIMGNRLVYGNYKDGYDLKDKFGEDLKLEFSTFLSSQEIGNSTLIDSTSPGYYTIGTTAQTINNSIIYFDLSKEDGSTVDLVSGAEITLDFRLNHSLFTGYTPSPTETTSSVNIVFDYTLPSTFNNVYSLATSTDFIEKVGTATNIQPVSTACDGATLTDQVNCALPQNLDTFSKTASGISANAQPLGIVSTPGSNTIGIQIISMQYVDGANSVYEFYEVISSSATFQELGNSQSLHSNRGYEVGIVYMDDFNRSSTALVSPQNTVQIPCANSIDKNSIQVTIPSQQLAPKWASRYKFVLKPDEDIYETIYSNILFLDPNSNAAYFLLEGDNASKIEDGDRLIVKRDSDGPATNCPIATVLERKTQLSNFITIPTGNDDAQGNPINIEIPSGVYMKINPSNFNVVYEENNVVNLPYDSVLAERKRTYPILAYSLSIEGTTTGQPTWTHINYDIPQGSKINFTINQSRDKDSKNWPRRQYELELKLTASKDYASIQEWFLGDNVGELLNDGSQIVTQGDSPIQNQFEPTYLEQAGAPDTTSPSSDIPTAEYTNYYKFYRNTTTNELFLLITGTESAGRTRNRRSKVSAKFDIVRTNDGFVFETEPQTASPDIWYENYLSLPINSDGEHQGNVQNQTASQSALINTNFFNCYAFGNGVESYKILDSINGKTVNIGERVTSTSNITFKEANRFADLTYSGVYNDETNVNKLNEFNLGLANFKPLEDSFGAIQILFARKTDILTLQEDKISYVLTGKNLISDSAGGGLIASIPEVLGQQIARTEKYGISNNPESFVSWGANKYFTDSKRGAVINLIGSNTQQEQLQVISEAGMRGWFRDLFIESNNTYKLGGFDPYMNEYVLHSNIQLPPVSTDCLKCDITKNIILSPGESFSYCVDLGNLLGLVDIDYIIPFQGFDDIVTELNSTTITELSEENIVAEEVLTGTGYTITAVYNGGSHTTGLVYESGKLTFNKNDVNATDVTLTVSHDSLTTDTIEINVGCPQSVDMTVFNVAITSNADATKFITNQYRWTDGSFISPLHSNQMQFSSSNVNPIVSQFTQVAGPQGAGIIPGDGAGVSLISRKEGFDNFVFNVTSNKFKYLRSNIYYNNTATDINALLAASTDVTPIYTEVNPAQYSAAFTMPVGGQFLYLIWDYREPTSSNLCYSTVDAQDACTGCTPIPTPTPTPTPTPVTTYRWLIEPGSGTTTSPSICPFVGTELYSTSSSFATVFANNTFFYTDSARTQIFQGNDNYFGIRQPSQGYGQAQGIFRMTNSGTASNIDTTGVCT